MHVKSQTPLDGQVPDEKFHSASFRAVSLSSGEWVKRRGCWWGIQEEKQIRARLSLGS